MRIAICGGGIGGLLLAHELTRRADFHVDVYEAATQFSGIGTGLGLWLRSRKVLRDMGLDDQVAAISCAYHEDTVPTGIVRKSDQPVAYQFSPRMIKGGCTTVHRGEFHIMLMHALDSRHNCTLHVSKRLVSYLQSSSSERPIKLAFKDGTEAECDVLVGSDGLRSSVRLTMMEELAKDAECEQRFKEAEEFRSCKGVYWSGHLVYRAVIPRERLEELAPDHPALGKLPMIHYIGRNGNILLFPIQKGKAFNFSGYVINHEAEGTIYSGPSISDVDPEEFIAAYHHGQGWEPLVQQALACLPGLPMNKWAVNVVKPLPTFASGRVALLGDAAHALMPHQGAGAGQVIEDVYILSTLLRDPRINTSNVGLAIQVYSDVRRPRAQQAAELSRLASRLQSFIVPGREGTDVDLKELEKMMQQAHAWVSEEDAKEDWESAVEKLDSALLGAHV